jgi:hypothetical protein
MAKESHPEVCDDESRKENGSCYSEDEVATAHHYALDVSGKST